MNAPGHPYTIRRTIDLATFLRKNEYSCNYYVENIQ